MEVVELLVEPLPQGDAVTGLVGCGPCSLGALHLAAFWWNSPSLSPPVWESLRAMLTGPVGSDLRIAPLVCYPEVLRLPGLLALWERRRMHRTRSVADDRDWLEQTGRLVEEWGMPALWPVGLWMRQHSGLPQAAGEPRPARGRWRRLPVPLPHAAVPVDTHMEQLTCLPCRFGDEPQLPDATQVWSVAGQT
ncbi:hypothetical protein ACFV3R_33125 [Streptomyces sp. NPDC059740]|uniref:hypothetical protein n=1 Tax=Streptomyces sp. NPDC059740 TaxID=3346926 RepID=UPI00364AC6F1